MYILFVVDICLMNVQTSLPRHPTKSRLCVVLLEAPQNAQSRHTSRTLYGCSSSAHVLNKHGSSFSWQERLASDVDWPPLGKILSMTEQEVNLRGIGEQNVFPIGFIPVGSILLRMYIPIYITQVY
jgi:hypothetical protein